MIWVSWRQHRSQAITCLGLLVALTVFAIMAGDSMRTAFSQDDLAGCAARQGLGCPAQLASFMNQFSGAYNIAFYSVLLLLPGLIGVVIGAPLLGRELEFGTWRMAWSQTVPRTRWLLTNLAVVGGGLVLLGAAMTALITWFREPMDRLTGHLYPNVYDYEGLVFTAYIVCAFGLAVLAGLLMRRSIPAMITALVVWLAIRLSVEFGLRPHLLVPLTTHRAPCDLATTCRGIGTGITSVPSETGRIGDWVLSQTPGGLVTYQPASRFWELQSMEAGLFVAIAAVALGVTFWLLHRRPA
jgi:hypothetical protein